MPPFLLAFAIAIIAGFIVEAGLSLRLLGVGEALTERGGVHSRRSEAMGLRLTVGGVIEEEDSKGAGSGGLTSALRSTKGLLVLGGAVWAGSRPLNIWLIRLFSYRGLLDTGRTSNLTREEDMACRNIS